MAVDQTKRGRNGTTGAEVRGQAAIMGAREMSRKYMNDRWCVRCGRCEPTPFLKKHVAVLLDGHGVVLHRGSLQGLDIGCSNGRNMNYLRKFGVSMVGLDMAMPNRTAPFMLGRDEFPIALTTACDIILMNYVLMFLDKAERKQVYHEISMVASFTAKVMLEFYPAKDSHMKTEDRCVRGLKEALTCLKQYGFSIMDVKNKLRAIVARR